MLTYALERHSSSGWSSEQASSEAGTYMPMHMVLSWPPCTGVERARKGTVLRARGDEYGESGAGGATVDELATALLSQMRRIAKGRKKRVLVPIHESPTTSSENESESTSGSGLATRPAKNVSAGAASEGWRNSRNPSGKRKERRRKRYRRPVSC